MKPKKKLHPLVIAVIILLLLAVGLCAVVAGLWFSGRNAVSKPNEAPELPQGETEEDNGIYVTYNGKRYRYNDQMYNVLLMGVDAEVNPSEAEGIKEQSDVVMLGALDLAANKLTMIAIPRDLMCEVEQVDENGNHVGLTRTQLTMAYYYGDGRHGSCKLVSEAVSNLFYGLPIQGYAAYFLNGIGALNDAVGGVTVVVSDDYPFLNMAACHRMVSGTTLTLTGEEAEYYIRCRWAEHPDGAAHRLMRQKQYMLALIDQAKAAIKENPASLFTMYDAVDDYLLTNVSLSEISYLATKAVGMDFSGQFRTVEGTSEIVMAGDKAYLEVTADQNSLYELMLDVFYTEVPEQEQPS